MTTFTVYDLEFMPIAQFDNYKELKKYLGISIDSIYSYLSKSKKNEEKIIKNKNTNELVYIRRDNFKEY